MSVGYRSEAVSVSVIGSLCCAISGERTNGECCSVFREEAAEELNTHISVSRAETSKCELSFGFMYHNRMQETHRVWRGRVSASSPRQR